ncbi:serine/threonine-protein kinase 36-like isoform X2 [Babylonia areolata]|uniref:serine/threonine-protein kinase 36-like isoform X2 n=1 Tax=Babylonia areolata TaxID=304850 RepID=UPI003FD6B925
MGMNNYHVLDIIGEGSFGKVYRGRRKYTGQIVALKFIPQGGKSAKDLRGLRREIDIMRGLHHDNIIEMLDSFDTDKEVVVVTDYAEGELFTILEDDGSLPEEQVQTIAAQLVSALYYLHSHRILHRDMKPQNILLGKGGTVKLCDFGFARGMSTNTLVLTSIKGTPLYMSPELVEEKPYDHTADLWAMGCILYELYVGTPPFYTNSIFQLVSMIIKDPVKWPKTMSSVFKDFLQGLLNKNPRQRLSWPDLLHHPFVASSVKVAEADSQLESPFTQPLTASMMVLKEQQSKEKAHPPGTSKILARARRKALEDEPKAAPPPDKAPPPAEPRPQAWEGDQRDGGGGEGEGPTTTAPPSHLAPDAWETSSFNKNVDPTPRPDRISKDYKKEYPSIEVEGRRTIKKKGDTKKNIENVRLEAEEADSEDEWQSLIEATDQEGDAEMAMGMLGDAALMDKLRSRLDSSAAQVLVGTLEGAARLRSVLRVITNLVTLKCEVTQIITFTQAMGIPGKILQLLSDILSTQAVIEQPWAQQILIDLVITINAYFASEISWAEDKDQSVVAEYCGAMQTFLTLVPRLVSLHIDADLRLLEQTLLCVIYQSEAMERSAVEQAEQYYQSVAGPHKHLVHTLLLLTNNDAAKLSRLTDLPEVTTEMAVERMEQLVNLAASCLSAFVHAPLKGPHAAVGKTKVAGYLSELLCEGPDQDMSRHFFLLLCHPPDCSTVLKILYACCQASQAFCSYLCDNGHLDSLLDVLIGKVPVADMEVNTVVETVLYILCTLVIQMQQLPDRLSDASAMMVSIFLDSTLASHTAAAALLFSQMVACGVSCEVQPEEMLQACLSVFTDLAQVCVRCPFDYGILDGLLLLLRELVPQVDMPVAQLYIETGIWGAMWHRVAQALQVTSPTDHLPIHDIEVEGQGSGVGQAEFSAPDWDLMSPQGLMAVLQIAVSVFTKETYQCLPNLATADSIVMLTLVHLLHPSFLHNITHRYKEEGEQLREDVLLAITQLGCFPFAVDINDDLLAEIQMCLFSSKLLPRLLGASALYLHGERLETPVGLMTRLVLGNAIFVQQFASAIADLKVNSFLWGCLAEDSPLSVVCDMVSITSHLVRTSPQHLALVISILRGAKGDFSPLTWLMSHSSTMVKSRTCGLLGNLMKYDSQLYPVLAQREKILQGLVACLKDGDGNVRKGAVYAIGNASYHSGQLYPRLKAAIPALVQLLRDTHTKTRANAASACGNLGMHSPVLCGELRKAKVLAHLLEVTCHDSQASVQVSALLALRSLCQQDDLRKELLALKAVERLTQLTQGTPRPPSSTPTPPRSDTPLSRPGSSLANNAHHSGATLLPHCRKLLKALQAAS